MVGRDLGMRWCGADGRVENNNHEREDNGERKDDGRGGNDVGPVEDVSDDGCSGDLAEDTGECRDGEFDGQMVDVGEDGCNS